MSQQTDIVLEKGLPCSPESEKFLLASVIMDGERISEIAGSLSVEDFSSQANRLVFRRLNDLAERGARIGLVELAEELKRHNELAGVGGITALMALEDGIPAIRDLSSYIRLVKDKSALRRIIHVAGQLSNRAFLAGESPDDILAGAEDALLGISQTRQAGEDHGLLSAGDFLTNFPGGFNAFASPATRTVGLSTGFTRYDEMTGGLRRGEMTILAARPSMGKTGLAMNIAWFIAVHYQEPVAVFSLEMSRESLLLRMLCGAARVDSQRLRAGYLNQAEMAKIRESRSLMVDAPIYLDDAADIGLMELHAKLRRFRQVQKRSPRLVVVDYLQLMKRPGRGDNENADLTRLSRGLKLLAKEEDCAFLVLSQLSRASETRAGDKKPQLSDLRGSGALEQDADVVAFVHRAEVYQRDREDLRGLAELIIGKQRNGPIGEIKLVFLHSMVKFENRAEDLGDLATEARLPHAD